MKALTNQEIKFLKETRWTPTLYQMDYKKTPLMTNKDIEIIYFHYEILARNYKINIQTLYNKFTRDDEIDAISLEDEAVWLLYNFFTEEDLKTHNNKFFLDWLQDFQYYNGYRKWDESDVMSAINTVFEIYSGNLEFYTDDNGSVGVRSKDELFN